MFFSRFGGQQPSCLHNGRSPPLGVPDHAGCCDEMLRQDLWSLRQWGVPPLSLDGLCHGKSQSKLDDLGESLGDDDE